MDPHNNYVSPFIKKEQYSDIDVDKVYYINLNRAVDRNKHFLDQCKKARIPFHKIQRFDAIDGTTYKFNEQEKNMFVLCDYLHQPFVSKIMGNQLSHYNILQDMIQKGYSHILVFQDDAILRDGFVSILNKTVANLPENAELVNIGFHSYASDADFLSWDFTRNDDRTHLSKSDLNEYVCHLNDYINPCSLAYIVTLKGAKALVDHFQTYGFKSATDWNYNRYLQDKNIFYGSTSVLTTGNHKFESSIFK